MFSPSSRPVASFLPYAPPDPIRISARLSKGLPLPPIHSLAREDSTARILATLPSRSSRLTEREPSSLRWLLTPPGDSGDHRTDMAYQTAQPPLATSLEKQLPSIPYTQPGRIIQRPPARLQTLHHPSTVDLVQQQSHLPGPPLHQQQYLQTERSHTTTATPQYTSSHQLNSPLSPIRDSYSKFESLRRVKMARSVRDGILVHASSQLPVFINSKGGSIADFAAQMTCLFWFESIDVLRSAEKFQEWSPVAPLPPLTMFARPENSFKKWIANVLSTTQVTQNVILLAVLFIYRLKMFNPSVWGRPGSEYRLLTVALMLGNKFLDDNTYTNKTWAEVSGIVVPEIHVMEVEFLSNMRYNLVVTRHEWDNWLDKLGNFLQYCTCAGERPTVQPLSPGLPMPSPIRNGYHSSPLPSPVNLMAPVLPIVPRYHHPLGLAMTNSFEPTNLLPVTSTRPPHPSTLSSPNPVEIGTKPHSSRKRGFADEDATDHPAKRPSRHLAGHPPPLTITTNRNPGPVVSQSLRLPVPSLSLITTQPQASFHPPTGFYPAQDSVSLPPLGQGIRAMSTVYPPPAAGIAHLPGTATTPTRTSGHYGVSGNLSFGPPSFNGYRTPTKRQSPSRISAYGSSPPIESYSSNSATTLCTPVGHAPANQAIHSPSLYLQHRASPYKPVRHVNALLYPPPAASFNNHPISITPLQMYYQPLGRRHDLRPGIVPGFVMTPGQTALLNHNHHPSISRSAFTQQP